MAGVILAVCCICILAGTASAQTFGEIAGVVKDPSGAVIPGATVTATNTATNAMRVTQTNEAGIYTFPSLVPGNYSVKAEMPGFQTMVRSDVQLQVQQSARIDFTMQIGQRTDTVDSEQRRRPCWPPRMQPSGPLSKTAGLWNFR